MPGLVASGIVNALCVREKRTEFDKVVDALLHTFVVIAIYAIIVGKIPLELHATADAKDTTYSLEIIRAPFLALLGISVAWSLLYSGLDNNDFVFMLLRRLRVTTRTARTTVWHDVFSTYVGSGYVQVMLEDGTSVLGYLRKYSETPSESSLFLEDACWVDDDGNTTPVDGPGIFLTKPSGIKTIMFLHPERAESTHDKFLAKAVGK